MTAFRVIDPFQTFFDLQGRLAAGGRIDFFEAGTTTAQDVYGDQALTVNNGSSIDLGTDGRPVDDVWGSGDYRARVYAADGTLIIDRDNIEIPGGSGTTIPALLANQFLTNDGAVLLWEAIRQLPDPTGQADKLLSTDGTNFTWTAQQTLPNLPITVSSTGVQFGNTGGKAFVVLTGSDSAPASGLTKTTKAITYGQTLATILYAGVQVTSVSQAGGPVVAELSADPTNTGFTVSFDIAEGNSGQAYFNNAVPFRWFVLGIVDVAA